MGRSAAHPYLSRRENQLRKKKLREKHPMQQRKIKAQKRRGMAVIKQQQVPHDAALIESKLQRMKQERINARQRAALEDAITDGLDEDPEICAVGMRAPPPARQQKPQLGKDIDEDSDEDSKEYDSFDDSDDDDDLSVASDEMPPPPSPPKKKKQAMPKKSKK
eukprot:PhM_4_TR5472/c0_g1_i1/m.17936